MSRGTLDPALLTRLSLTGLSPSLAGFPKTILLNLSDQLRGPNPGMHAFRFGLFRFRSPLLTESHVVFSSSGYLDVSVHRVPLLTLCIGVRILEVCSSGFPHSEISGSKDICSSPKLFAAYHVFHRLLVPRHPPCALISLTFHIHSVECAVSCLCPSCDGFSYFYFVFYLETDLTPSSSDVFFFCLQKILPLFSGALFLRQVLRFLFLLYSVFKVPVWPAVSSAIKIYTLYRL